MKNYTYIIFLLSIGLFSCGEEIDIKEELHQELQETLLEASEERGLDFFKLPNQTEFNKIPQDPKNPITSAKVSLGKQLFHETAFATEGKFPITGEEYSCASCHHARAGFQAGIAQGLGEGGEGFGIMGESRTRNMLCDAELCDVQPIRTPTILNGAYQPLMLWNGQFGATGLNEGTEENWTPDTPKETNNLGFEGLEIQAIAGLEVHRIGIDQEAVEANGYKSLFDNAFPDTDIEERYNLVTAGLAIAAYERTVTAYNSPFQKYLRGNSYAMSPFQKEGAILFFGKANCVSCHTGPALNKMEFHALGMNEFKQEEVTHYNPEDPTRFGRFSFTANEADRFKFKTPQLYNLKDASHFGHGASFTTIEEVIQYKNKGIAENNEVPQNVLSPEFQPLNLSDEEVKKIAAFVKYSLHDPDLNRFVPSSTLSGNCFPNNDIPSQNDLGCN